MKAKLLCAAALLCASAAAANAVTWRIDFTSGRGSGFFEIDGSSFVIPLSAVHPTAFTVTAADLTINSGSFLGQFHYVAGDVATTNCTPAECALAFKVGPITVPQIGTYSAVYIQFNSAQIWDPWVTPATQTLQLFFHTDPFASSIAWNDVASAERTEIDPTPLPAALPLFASGGALLGFLGWRRKRKQIIPA